MKNFFLAVLILANAACTDRNAIPFPNNNQEDQNTVSNDEQNSENHNAEFENSNGQVVTIMDNGLYLPLCQYTIPEDWKCLQDVANSPTDGNQIRHQVDFFSNQNQLLRNKGSLNYFHLLGTTFDSQLRKSVNEGIKDFSQLKFGTLVLNEKVMNDPKTKQQMSSLLAQNTKFEQLEMPFTGVRNGQSIQGRVDVSHFALVDYNGNYSAGQVVVRLVSSTPEMFATTDQMVTQIDKSYKANPAHGNRIAQLMNNTTQQIDANTASNTRAHEQRMNDMQSNFDAHQQKMAGMQQSHDQQNQQWMDKNFSNSSSATGNGYGNHEQFIDQINEQSTFNDPSSGYNVHKDGQYNYWYTDGQGHYHGTDDVNFNANTLGNDWYQTQELKP